MIDNELQATAPMKLKTTPRLDTTNAIIISKLMNAIDVE
jgi:hypothetical protein